MKITAQSLKSPIAPTWCPGCGNFNVWRALHQALAATKIDGKPLQQENLLLTYGVGCCSNEADFNLTYGIHSLHGRPIPNAIGAKLANHELTAIAIGGDGGLYGEGLNHLLFAARGNHDITVMVHNNWRYSLTTGQASPTTQPGTVTKTTPEGLIEKQLNPLQTALSAQASFVARGYANDRAQLKQILQAAFTHRGFALVDIITPCVTFNKQQDFSWYKQHIIPLPEEHQAQDYQAALQLSQIGPWGNEARKQGEEPAKQATAGKSRAIDKQPKAVGEEKSMAGSCQTGPEVENSQASIKTKSSQGKVKLNKFYTGIFYQDQTRPAYHEQVAALQKGTLLEQWRAQRDLQPVMQAYF